MRIHWQMCNFFIALEEVRIKDLFPFPLFLLYPFPSLRKARTRIRASGKSYPKGQNGTATLIVYLDIMYECSFKLCQSLLVEILDLGPRCARQYMNS